MKKIATLFAVTMFVASFSHAQRISSFSIDGIQALGPSAAFNPTLNSETVPGVVEIVYPNTVDLSNVTPVFNLSADGTMVTSPLPTDFSQMQNVKIQKTEGTDWNLYDIVCKKINPTTLPFELPVGEGFSESWTASTSGWAAARLDRRQTVARFNLRTNLIVAFTDVPDKLNFSIYSSALLEEDAIFDIEESADGITWTSVVQYTGANPLPLNAATADEKAQSQSLNSSSRYVRFVYTTRRSANVIVSELSITKGAGGSSLENKAADNAVVYVVPGTRELYVSTNSDIAKIELYNVAGHTSLVEVQPTETVSLNGLSAGVYLAVVTNSDGNVSINKIVIR